ncbi:MAG TPA: MBL fold metallo-hydrolase, partial [Candidatus Paceibacterota bacterium]
MKSQLTFCGGAGSVTGANFLLKSGDLSLLVDCGMEQGGELTDLNNWKPFPYDPSSIDVLIVTHAHIDHIGRIPKLVRDGFRGAIYSTEATRAIAEPLLEDSAGLLEHIARHNDKPILYTKEDIVAAMKLWHGIPYHQTHALKADFSFELIDAGHILGSAMVKLVRNGRTIIFTGDLGSASVLLPPHDSVAGANYVVMESVYGASTHPYHDPNIRRDNLRNAIVDISKRGGTLLIPAFATERTQDLLFELRTIYQDGGIPEVPVYLDAPLAEKLTATFLTYPQYFNDEMKARIGMGENIFSFPGLHIVEDSQASHALSQTPGPKVIIAGSGMAQGGRILSHEQSVLPDARSTLLIVGYQAAGSIGRRLVDGARFVTIMGEKVPVRCRIEQNLG